MMTIFIVAGILALALAGVLKSNEFNISGGITWAKGTRKFSESWSYNEDQSGKDYDAGTVMATPTATDAEGVNVPIKAVIGTVGLARFKNNDPQNDIKIGGRVGGTFLASAIIKANGKPTLVYLGLAANNIYATTGANPASELDYIAWEA